jgi:hypothetical protein
LYEHDKDGEKIAIFGFYEQTSPHKIPAATAATAAAAADDDDDDNDEMLIA